MTPDISEYLDYDWYDPCWYLDEEKQFLGSKRIMRRWLGVSHRGGKALCYYVLTSSGKVISRSTVQMVTQEKMSTTEVTQGMVDFNKAVWAAIGDDVLARGKGSNDTALININQVTQSLWDEENLKEAGEERYDPWEPSLTAAEVDYIDEESMDRYLKIDVVLPTTD